MITDPSSGTCVDEIAQDIYRITVPLRIEAIPGGFSFSHFLIAGEEPLLFHTGYRQFFPLVRQAVNAILPPERLRYIGFSHYEPDECGSLDSFLAIAPKAQPFSSDIGVMISLGGPFDRPSLGLANGQELTAGTHRLKWLATPHLPHAWDCGILYDETTGTLLCGDLFAQGGSDNPPVTESEILSASEGFRKGMDAYAHAPQGGLVLRQLAALQPKLLACQHGSSYRGDGGALLTQFADVLDGELQRREK